MRLAHIPQTKIAYEVVSCLNWEPVVEISIEIMLHKVVKTKEFALQPYATKKLNEISITIISLQKPYSPLMENKFVLSEKETLTMPQSFQLPVACPNASMALRKFSGCYNRLNCICENLDSPNTCHCPETTIETIRAEDSNRFPIKTPFLEITSENDEIYAFSHEGETTLAISSSLMLDSANYVVIEECNLTPEQISGCYECLEGATLQISCFTEIETWITLRCESQIFSLQCTPKNSISNISLEFDHAVVKEKCHTTCGGVELEVPLQGILRYHPQNAKKSVFVNNDVHTSQGNWLTDVDIPDLAPMVEVIKNHWKAAIAAIGGVTLLIAATYMCGPTVIILLTKVVWIIIESLFKTIWQLSCTIFKIMRECATRISLRTEN
ncbi:hypothetical protein Y032_0063g3446 [Ancylostoma ceylanicum]|nr:hypothetical protein Y032_0063g3446 [Ancylostoma ceylanicum]